MTMGMLGMITVGAILASSAVLWLYGALAGRAHSGALRLLWGMLWLPALIAPGFGILLAAIRYAQNYPLESPGFTVALWSGLLPGVLLWAGSVYFQERLLRRRLEADTAG